MSRLTDLRNSVLDVLFGDVWLCECCMIMLANGECCADSEHGGDGIAPLSALDDRYRMALGTSEHSEYCEVDRDGECDCDRTEFSSAQCDGCGSWLAGSRYGATLWRVPQRFSRPNLPA